MRYFGKGVLLLNTQEERVLRGEIEALRKKLDRMVERAPELLNSPETYALSARLDQLITRYMKLKGENPN